MKRFILCLLAVFVSGVLLAEEVLNNAAIIELQGMNLGESVIIEKIKTSKCSFDTSLAGLKQLKGAKVPDPVIQAMVAAGAAPVKSSTPVAGGDSNDPTTPHAAGVFLLKDKKLVRLESEVSGEMTHGGYVGPWGIGKTAQTVRIAGLQSELELTERRPVFYLYLGTAPAAGQQNYAAEFVAAQSPREVALILFRTKDKDRVLEVGKGGAYGGSSGMDTKALREFDSEKIADGIYKVTPKEDLGDGEYAFSSVQTRGHGRFFTFSVKGGGGSVLDEKSKQ